MIRIPQYTIVRRCNAAVYLVASFAEKMEVWVRLSNTPFSNSDLKFVWLLDIHEYFEEDIKGPAEFRCETGKGCTFSEPAMDELILTFFGDPMITLQCESGECLHYSQVPGYVVCTESPCGVQRTKPLHSDHLNQIIDLS